MSTNILVFLSVALRNFTGSFLMATSFFDGRIA